MRQMELHEFVDKKKEKLIKFALDGIIAEIGGLDAGRYLAAMVKPSIKIASELKIKPAEAYYMLLDEAKKRGLVTPEGLSILNQEAEEFASANPGPDPDDPFLR